MYNNNTQYNKFKPMKKSNPPQNYPNYKLQNYNYYNVATNKGGENGFVLNNSRETYQNKSGRNAFFQNFWKNYQKSYDYDYYATSSDLLKSTTDFFNEINNIFENNPKRCDSLNVYLKKLPFFK